MISSGSELVESRFHKVERVMVLEPLAELGKLSIHHNWARPGSGVFFFYSFTMSE